MNKALFILEMVGFTTVLAGFALLAAYPSSCDIAMLDAGLCTCLAGVGAVVGSVAWRKY